jgi:hypothetical protein
MTITHNDVEVAVSVDAGDASILFTRTYKRRGTPEWP